MQGEWGTICDDGWDQADAKVVCRQLGFSALFSTSAASSYVEGWHDHCLLLCKISHYIVKTLIALIVVCSSSVRHKTSRFIAFRSAVMALSIG